MGEQVADNTEMQYTTTLKISDKGSFYVETSSRANRGLIKKEYKPTGKTLVYPSEWGKEKGARVLVNSLIEDQTNIIEQAKSNIEKLENLKQAIDSIGIQ